MNAVKITLDTPPREVVDSIAQLREQKGKDGRERENQINTNKNKK